MIPAGSYNTSCVRFVMYETKRLLLVVFECPLSCWNARNVGLLEKGAAAISVSPPLFCDLLVESGRCSCFGSGVVSIPFLSRRIKVM